MFDSILLQRWSHNDRHALHCATAQGVMSVLRTGIVWQDKAQEAKEDAKERAKEAAEGTKHAAARTKETAEEYAERTTDGLYSGTEKAKSAAEEAAESAKIKVGLYAGFTSEVLKVCSPDAAVWTCQ